MNLQQERVVEMAKRYYWLKLKEDFFNQKEIKLLRRIAGGDTYTVIYLKMLLLSLKTDGKIYFDGVGNDFVDELSLEIDEDTENIRVTVSFLQAKGLLEVVNENEYYLNELPCMVGSESESARRVRKHRQRKKELEKKDKTLQCNTKSVTSNTSETKSNIEIEKEIEKDLEIDLEEEEEKAPSSTTDAIVFYQNNFGLISPAISEHILSWINDMGDEMVIEALDRALKRNKPSWGYAERILKDWARKGIATIQQAEAEEIQFQNQMRNKRYTNNQAKSNVVPDWFKQQKIKQKEQAKQKPDLPKVDLEKEKRELEEMLAERLERSIKK